MATTLFTGPILAGNVVNTTGTTVANAGGSTGLQNVGFVQMAQVADVTQSTTASATSIVIPANSVIIDIYVILTTAWTNTSTFSVGYTTSANEFTTVTSSMMSAGGTGYSAKGYPTTTTQAAVWKNVSSGQSTATDRRIYIVSSAAGTGAGQLMVAYLQGVNGFTSGKYT